MGTSIHWDLFTEIYEELNGLLVKQISFAINSGLSCLKFIMFSRFILYSFIINLNFL